MSLKERIQRQLESARQLSERMLADFKSPEQWTHQVCEGGNHALWFAGHMANTDNFLISLVAPQRAREQDGFAAAFGMGSKPQSSAEQYPPVDEVLSTMRERRATLLDVLATLTDDDLSRPTPAGAPDFLADFASVFELAVWHEGLHSGQLSVVRRSLGHAPLLGAAE
ncbi:MAG: DinB family protein [Pirellulaceae bacterium]